MGDAERMKPALNTITILEKSGFLFGFGPLPVTNLGRWSTTQLNKLLHSRWNGMVLIFRIPPPNCLHKNWLPYPPVGEYIFVRRRIWPSAYDVYIQSIFIFSSNRQQANPFKDGVSIHHIPNTHNHTSHNIHISVDVEQAGHFRTSDYTCLNAFPWIRQRRRYNLTTE